MPGAISEEQQHEITSNHLKGGMKIEGWLTPFILTVSLVLIFIVVMVVRHILKQRRNSDLDTQVYEQANTGDSDDLLRCGMAEDGAMANGSAVTDSGRSIELVDPLPRHQWPPQQSRINSLPSSDL